MFCSRVAVNLTLLLKLLAQEVINRLTSDGASNDGRLRAGLAGGPWHLKEAAIASRIASGRLLSRSPALTRVLTAARRHHPLRSHLPLKSRPSLQVHQLSASLPFRLSGGLVHPIMDRFTPTIWRQSHAQHSDNEDPDQPIDTPPIGESSYLYQSVASLTGHVRPGDPRL